VHGITPQKTLADGISEAEFAKYLTAKVSTPGTVMVGFNNLRFDNKFIQFILWRNFYDPYEWSWKDDRSTWDLLDLVRMTRALRPDGIKWPFAPDGKPSNRLEYLSAVNKLDHVDAHDALSDVNASIALARLVKSKQPQLFDYLFKHRSKREVAPLVLSKKPFIYTSGKYPSDWEKTTVVSAIALVPNREAALVYGLRIDPDEFKDFSAEQLAERWSAYGPDAPYFPVKELVFNKSPAVVAELGVLYKPKDTLERLQLRMELINSHYKKLQAVDGFGEKFIKALEIRRPKRQPEIIADPQKVDAQLYDGFVKDDDKTKMSVVRAAKPEELYNLDLEFKDERLKLLTPLYKARNFPKFLSQTEQINWEKFRQTKLLASNAAGDFFSRLEELAKTPGMDGEKQYLLEELNLYAQSIMPMSD